MTSDKEELPKLPMKNIAKKGYLDTNILCALGKGAMEHPRNKTYHRLVGETECHV